MNTHEAKGYCEYIFREAGLDSFQNWWSSKDPELDEKPSIAVVQTPRLVIDRAEKICDFEKTVKAA